MKTVVVVVQVCLEFLMDSLQTANILPCGHAIHTKCQKQLIRSGTLHPALLDPLHSTVPGLVHASLITVSVHGLACFT